MAASELKQWIATAAPTESSLEQLQHQYAGYCHALMPHLTDAKKAPVTLYDFLAAKPNTSEFIRLVDQVPQIKHLLQNKDYSSTAWVPSNTALQQLSNELSEEDVLALLQRHISPSFLPIYFLLTAPTVDTIFNPDRLNGAQRITVRPSLNGLRVNSHAAVIEQDHLVANGLVHLIDQVLPPRPTIAAFLAALPSSDFDLFQSAVKQSGAMQNILRDESRRGGTIFIPTNEAFRKLPDEVQTYLFSDEGAASLQTLLRHHVIANQSLYSNRFYDQDSAPEHFIQTPEATPDHTIPTPENQADRLWRILKGVRRFSLPTCLDGQHLTVAVTRCGGLISMKVNGSANVTVQDGLASDGVCHVVDSVLFPPLEDEDAEAQPVLSVEDVKSRLG
ncbi:FAS1 domain-containing protein [Aspergillus costaricaensis CBS 115574]|uniref:FAS1 domain-containing protein n=1 Tax=Aspergillus costaricaensis CBS 115574 TaxID=1448317 RepID=A0ACD1IV42_9EURO|nr:FAS1 domain-containing protein [Aspergillus costaricaensis CBS 115574]RAK94516.1 FAS1 domain-containing protein [Aspergillus costaricaensis CBS 115574]